MSQSGFIAALLLAAFVLYLAAQNRLVTYANVLWGNTGKPIPKPAPQQSNSGGGIIDKLTSSAGSAAEVAALAGAF